MHYIGKLVLPFHLKFSGIIMGASGQDDVFGLGDVFLFFHAVISAISITS